MSDARHYEPIGTIYHVEFLDGYGYHWQQVVAVPFKRDVMEVLAILERAYPGRKVKSLKDAGCIHHGHISEQAYGKE